MAHHPKKSPRQAPAAVMSLLGAALFACLPAQAAMKIEAWSEVSGLQARAIDLALEDAKTPGVTFSGGVSSNIISLTPYPTWDGSPLMNGHSYWYDDGPTSATTPLTDSAGVNPMSGQLNFTAQSADGNVNVSGQGSVLRASSSMSADQLITASPAYTPENYLYQYDTGDGIYRYQNEYNYLDTRAGQLATIKGDIGVTDMYSKGLTRFVLAPQSGLVLTGRLSSGIFADRTGAMETVKSGVRTWSGEYPEGLTTIISHDSLGTATAGAQIALYLDNTLPQGGLNPLAGTSSALAAVGDTVNFNATGFETGYWSLNSADMVYAKESVQDFTLRIANPSDHEVSGYLMLDIQAQATYEAQVRDEIHFRGLEVPEPASVQLMGLGLAALAWLGLRGQLNKRKVRV